MAESQMKRYILDNTKTCISCSTEKDLSLFFKDIRYSKGVKSKCKECYVNDSKSQKAEYRERNKEKIYTKHKLYRESNKQKILLKHKEWLENNKNRVNKTNNSYNKNRIKHDLNYKIKRNLRSKISLELKSIKKSDSTLNILGCSIVEFRDYISSKFIDGMSWENYGRYGWHIDHIKPCASFDLTKEEEQRKCFHYTNMQPLWWLDNIKKGKKYV